MPDKLGGSAPVIIVTAHDIAHMVLIHVRLAEYASAMEIFSGFASDGDNPMVLLQFGYIGLILLFRYISEQRQTTVEIGRSVLSPVLTRATFSDLFRHFTYEKRRGRESNPRIAVLQTATLPLGYPAELRERTISLWRRLYQALSIERQVFAATTASAPGQRFNASANPVIVSA